MLNSSISIKFLISFFILGFLPSAFSGGSDTGGGDTKGPDNGAMWFTGAGNSVRICFESQPGVKSIDTLSEGSVKKSVQRAFDMWSKYFQERVIHKYDLVYGNPANSPAFRFDFLPTCTPSADLTFYLGIDPPNVNIEKQKYVNPIAFASRQSYDAARGWGAGFIWIAPTRNGSPWSESTLSALVLHELGHVFGCSHVEGTIMTEKIVLLLNLIAISKIPSDQLLLSRIDANRELLINPTLGVETAGFVLKKSLLDLIPSTKMNSTQSNFASLKKVSGNLYRLSGEGFESFDLQVSGEPTRVFGDAAIFKLYREGPLPSPLNVYYWLTSRGTIEYGQSEVSPGKKINFTIERNLNSGGPPLVVRYFSEFGIQTLFESYHVGW